MPKRVGVSDHFLEGLLMRGWSTSAIARREDVPLGQTGVHRRLTVSGALNRLKARRAEHAQEFARLHREEKMSIAELQELTWHDYSRPKIRDLLAEAGVKLPVAVGPDGATGQHLREMYESGMTIRDICSELPGNPSYGNVRARLIAAGTEFRSRGS